VLKVENRKQKFISAFQISAFNFVNFSGSALEKIPLSPFLCPMSGRAMGTAEWIEIFHRAAF
jgi:hypothetical protein